MNNTDLSYCRLLLSQAQSNIYSVAVLRVDKISNTCRRILDNMGTNEIYGVVYVVRCDEIENLINILEMLEDENDRS